MLAPLLIEGMISQSVSEWGQEYFWLPSVLNWPKYFFVIWLHCLFPHLILDGEEGNCIYIDPDSVVDAIPDLQSFYYRCADWEEWHVVGWRLSFINASNY